MGEKFSVLMSLYKNEKPAYLAAGIGQRYKSNC